MNVAVVGAGRIGAFHARTLADHDDVDGVVVADVDGERARSVADSCGGRVAGSVDDAIGAADAVVIAASTSAHVELVERAAAARRATYCEKPVAFTTGDLRRAIAAIDDARVPFQVGFQRRFDAGFAEARRRIGADDIGRVYALRMVSADREPPPAGYVSTSGGIFRDMHVHDFDALRFLTGAEVVEVYATGALLGLDTVDPHGDDSASALVMTLSDGSLATLTGARQHARGYDVRVEVSGTEGTLAIGLDPRTPMSSAEGGVAFPDGDPYTGFLDRFAQAYRAEMAAFVDLAAGRGPNLCTGADALAALRAALAAGLSRVEHRPVGVDEIT